MTTSKDTPLTDEELNSVFVQAVENFLESQLVQVEELSQAQRNALIFGGDPEQMLNFSCFLVAHLAKALHHPEEVLVDGVALRPTRKAWDLNLLRFVRKTWF